MHASMAISSANSLPDILLWLDIQAMIIFGAIHYTSGLLLASSSYSFNVITLNTVSCSSYPVENMCM